MRGLVPTGGAKPEGQTNERNGASGKTVQTEHGPARVERPHDRDGSFTPTLIPKHERRFTGYEKESQEIRPNAGGAALERLNPQSPKMGGSPFIPRTGPC